MSGSIVQSTYSADSNDSSATTVSTSAFASANTAGNAIPVYVFWYTTDTPSSAINYLTTITDIAGNSYTIIDRIAIASGWQYAATAIAQNIAAQSGNVITGNFSTAVQYRRIVSAEVAGVSTTGQPDGNAAQASNSWGTGTDAITSGADTTTATCFIWGLGHNTMNTNTPAAGTGFTASLGLTYAAGDVIRTEFKVSAAAGSNAATFTSTGSGTEDVGAFMLALQESSGASFKSAWARGANQAILTR